MIQIKNIIECGIARRTSKDQYRIIIKETW